MNRLSPLIQTKLCEIILKLLDEDAAPVRLANFANFLFLLNLHKKEIPRNLLSDFYSITNDYVEIADGGHIALRSDEFSDAQKADLAERLLSIYIEIKGGALIF